MHDVCRDVSSKKIRQRRRSVGAQGLGSAKHCMDPATRCSTATRASRLNKDFHIQSCDHKPAYEQASEVAWLNDLGRVDRRAPATIEVVFDKEPYWRPGRYGLARCLRLEYKGLDRHAVAELPHGERVPKVCANL